MQHLEFGFCKRPACDVQGWRCMQMHSSQQPRLRYQRMCWIKLHKENPGWEQWSQAEAKACVGGPKGPTHR
eukprot:63261-Lingulodinium_polyedra.AAC.1